MVTEYGMSEKLGPLQFGQSQGQVFLGRDFSSEQNYSESIAYEIDQEMQRIVKEEYERTKKILTENRALLDLIATTLLEVETLDAEQINHLKDHGTLPDRPYDNNGKDKAETESSETKDDHVISDSTGAPSDPSIANLPKEREYESPPNPFDEKRRD
jgi:cell division protease FtsH